MIGKHFFLTALILAFPAALVFADSQDTSHESRVIRAEKNLKKNDSRCENIQYTHKNFRPETVKALPFPPGAFVEVKKCIGGTAQKKSTFSEEELNREKIQKEETVKKLSLLLSFIYHQQKNLAGSYNETDQAYHDLAQRNFPVPKVYDRAVTSYEDTLKSYGEYQAYLSALPRAVSDYEKKVGSSFQDFALQKEDGIITMMKNPSIADFSNSLDELNKKPGEPTAAGERPDKNTSESGNGINQKEAEQNFCRLIGAFAGGTVAEGIILATFSNPLGAVLGASLGPTLCSDNFYEKITLWPMRFRAKVVDMGFFIKGGLEKIGDGLYNIGKKYLYVSPSKTGDKIAEHFKNAKNWLNRKLGWQ